jgi:alpha-acetolactate decarboxylase
MELKIKDIAGFMIGILTPSMIAGVLGWGFKRLSRKVI